MGAMTSILNGWKRGRRERERRRTRWQSSDDSINCGKAVRGRATTLVDAHGG